MTEPRKAGIPKELSGLTPEQLAAAFKYAQEKGRSAFELNANNLSPVQGKPEAEVKNVNTPTETIVAQAQALPDGSVDRRILSPENNPVDIHKRMLEALVNGGDPNSLTEELMRQSKN